MSKHQIITLKQSLPNCPLGTEFYLSLDEKYYYNEPDDTTKQYIFSIDEVESNKEFFYMGDKTTYKRLLVWANALGTLVPEEKYFNTSLGLDLNTLFKSIHDAG